MSQMISVASIDQRLLNPVLGNGLPHFMSTISFHRELLLNFSVTIAAIVFVLALANNHFAAC